MLRSLIYSNIYISLAAALLTHGTSRLLGAESPSPALGTVVFFATLAVYNLDRLVGGDLEDRLQRTQRHRWIKESRRPLWVLTAASAVGVLVSLPFLQPATVVALAPAALVSLAYCLPLVRGSSDPSAGENNERRRLKELPGVKALAIALVWAFATVVVPAVEAGLSLTGGAVTTTFVERLVFVFALTLPFEVRDLQRDRAAGIRTLATMLGPRRTTVVATVLMVVLTAVAAARFTTTGDDGLLAMVVTGVATIAALVPSFRAGERSELYYVGILDGMLLLKGALLLL